VSNTLIIIPKLQRGNAADDAPASRQAGVGMNVNEQ